MTRARGGVSSRARSDGLPRAGPGAGCSPISGRPTPGRCSQGDEIAAELIVRDAIDARLTTAQIDDEIIAPALWLVGRLWARGEISIADEHLATSISLRVLALQREATRTVRARTGRKALLAAPEGEMHTVALQMISNLLRDAGYTVLMLGPDVPLGALAECRRPPRAAGRLPDGDDARRSDRLMLAIHEIERGWAGAGYVLGGRGLSRAPAPAARDPRLQAGLGGRRRRRRAGQAGRAQLSRDGSNGFVIGDFGPSRTYSAGMLVASRRDDAPRGRSSAPPKRAYWSRPASPLAMLVLTLVWGAQYGMGIRDPDGIIGWRFTFVLALVGGFWALDVIPRGIMAARTAKAPTWATLVATARERWPWGRFAFVLGSIVAFYVTYLCYRNIKSYLPLARPRLLDGELADFERSLFGRTPRRCCTSCSARASPPRCSRRSTCCS